ncbi:MAG: hypothetical protein JJU29_00530 [Verrucomicrobia bacterium]|nr:hypothetical protein [Verrucomicrobiota bacterium]MCH8510400.1 hypothetical protein [Kiritimatiellia bacterium]
MSEKEPTPFDFWYAVQNTHILQMPRRDLETFGTTRIHYHLLTESMDTVDKVRVREGTLNAAQPQILLPDHFKTKNIEGFEDTETNRFLEWLKQNQPQMRFLQYGFTISKQDVSDTLLNDPLHVVQDNVMEAVKRRDQANSAVLLGVEKPWEVCLLKLMVDLVERSAAGHVSELQERNLLPNPNLEAQAIEQDFVMAEQDFSRIPYLYKQLHRRGVFEEHQDRFFALVRRAERQQ